MAESNVEPTNNLDQNEEVVNNSSDVPTAEDVANDRSRKAVNASLFFFIIICNTWTGKRDLAWFESSSKKKWQLSLKNLTIGPVISNFCCASSEFQYRVVQYGTYAFCGYLNQKEADIDINSFVYRPKDIQYIHVEQYSYDDFQDRIGDCVNNHNFATTDFKLEVGERPNFDSLITPLMCHKLLPSPHEHEGVYILGSCLKFKHEDQDLIYTATPTLIDPDYKFERFITLRKSSCKCSWSVDLDDAEKQFTLHTRQALSVIHPFRVFLADNDNFMKQSTSSFWYSQTPKNSLWNTEPESWYCFWHCTLWLSSYFASGIDLSFGNAQFFKIEPQGTLLLCTRLNFSSEVWQMWNTDGMFVLRSRFARRGIVLFTPNHLVKNGYVYFKLVNTSDTTVHLGDRFIQFVPPYQAVLDPNQPLLSEPYWGDKAEKDLEHVWRLEF